MLTQYIKLIIFCEIILAVHPRVENKYHIGIDAYKNGNYQLSIQEFEDILNQGWESPEIYYNLGNAFFRLDEIGEAVWAYEKCLNLKPIHKDAIFNLSLANLKVIDRIDLPAPPVYLKMYNSLRNWLLLDDWFFLSTFIIMIFFIIRCFRILFGIGTIVRVENILIIFLILSTIITSHAYFDFQNENKAIILEPIVIAYSEPNEFSTKVMEIHEGLKVMTLGENESWIEIELLDGKKGWIKLNELKKLSETKRI